MIELIQSLFNTTKERIKNPIIGSFIISWTIINWKPLLYIITSSQNIETKICYIERNFSSWTSLLLLPLLFSIFYTLALPYINLFIHYILKDSISKKNNNEKVNVVNNINNQKEIEVAKINLEDAKTEAREKRKNNQKIEELELSLKKLKQENSKNIQLASLEKEKLNKELNTKINELEHINNGLMEQIDLKDMEDAEFSSRLRTSNHAISVLIDSILSSDELYNFKFATKYVFDDSTEFLEFSDRNGEVMILNLESKEFMSIKTFDTFRKTMKYKIHK